MRTTRVISTNKVKRTVPEMYTITEMWKMTLICKTTVTFQITMTIYWTETVLRTESVICCVYVIWIVTVIWLVRVILIVDSWFLKRIHNGSILDSDGVLHSDWDLDSDIFSGQIRKFHLTTTCGSADHKICLINGTFKSCICQAASSVIRVAGRRIISMFWAFQITVCSFYQSSMICLK